MAYSKMSKVDEALQSIEEVFTRFNINAAAILVRDYFREEDPLARLYTVHAFINLFYKLTRKQCESLIGKCRSELEAFFAYMYHLFNPPEDVPPEAAVHYDAAQELVETRFSIDPPVKQLNINPLNGFEEALEKAADAPQWKQWLLANASLARMAMGALALLLTMLGLNCAIDMDSFSKVTKNLANIGRAITGVEKIEGVVGASTDVLLSTFYAWIGEEYVSPKTRPAYELTQKVDALYKKCVEISNNFQINMLEASMNINVSDIREEYDILSKEESKLSYQGVTLFNVSLKIKEIHELITLLNEIAVACLQGSAGKQKPVVVWFCGLPGVGKSYWVTKVLADLGERLGRQLSVLNINIMDKYDNNKYQEVINHDDFGIADPVADAQRFHQRTTVAALNTVGAALTEKHRALKHKWDMVTANVAGINEGLHDLIAGNRRRDLVIEIYFPEAFDYINKHNRSPPAEWYATHSPRFALLHVLHCRKGRLGSPENMVGFLGWISYEQILEFMYNKELENREDFRKRLLKTKLPQGFTIPEEPYNWDVNAVDLEHMVECHKVKKTPSGLIAFAAKDLPIAGPSSARSTSGSEHSSEISLEVDTPLNDTTLKRLYVASQERTETKLSNTTDASYGLLPVKKWSTKIKRAFCLRSEPGMGKTYIINDTLKDQLYDVNFVEEEQYPHDKVLFFDDPFVSVKKAKLLFSFITNWEKENSEYNQPIVIATNPGITEDVTNAVLRRCIVADIHYVPTWTQYVKNRVTGQQCYDIVKNFTMQERSDNFHVTWSGTDLKLDSGWRDIPQILSMYCDPTVDATMIGQHVREHEELQPFIIPQPYGLDYLVSNAYISWSDLYGGSKILTEDQRTQVTKLKGDKYVPIGWADAFKLRSKMNGLVGDQTVGNPQEFCKAFNRKQYSSPGMPSVLVEIIGVSFGFVTDENNYIKMFIVDPEHPAKRIEFKTNGIEIDGKFIQSVDNDAYIFVSKTLFGEKYIAAKAQAVEVVRRHMVQESELRQAEQEAWCEAPIVQILKTLASCANIAFMTYGVYYMLTEKSRAVARKEKSEHQQLQQQMFDLLYSGDIEIKVETDPTVDLDEKNREETESYNRELALYNSQEVKEESPPRPKYDRRRKVWVRDGLSVSTPSNASVKKRNPKYQLPSNMRYNANKFRYEVDEQMVEKKEGFAPFKSGCYTFDWGKVHVLFTNKSTTPLRQIKEFVAPFGLTINDEKVWYAFKDTTFVTKTCDEIADKKIACVAGENLVVCCFETQCAPQHYSLEMKSWLNVAKEIPESHGFLHRSAWVDKDGILAVTNGYHLWYVAKNGVVTKEICDDTWQETLHWFEYQKNRFEIDTLALDTMVGHKYEYTPTVARNFVDTFVYGFPYTTLSSNPLNPQMMLDLELKIVPKYVAERCHRLFKEDIFPDTLSTRVEMLEGCRDVKSKELMGSMPAALCRLYVDGSFSVHGIFIGGNKILTVSHISPGLLTARGVLQPDKHWNCVRGKANKEWDLMIVEISDPTFQEKKDLMSQIITNENLQKMLNIKGVTIPVSIQGVLEIEKTIQIENIFAIAHPTYAIISEETDGCQYRGGDQLTGLHSTGVTQQGDCGKVLLHHCPSYAQKILGMAIAGNAFYSRMAYITQERVMNLLERKHGLDIDQLLVRESDGLLITQETLLDNGLTTVGSAAYAVHIPDRTKLKRTGLTLGEEDNVEPTILSKADPRNPEQTSVLTNSLLGFTTRKEPLGEEEAALVKESAKAVTNHLVNVLQAKGKKLRLLTTTEAINGTDPIEYPNCKPIERSSSVGYPLKYMFAKVNTKGDLLYQNQKNFQYYFKDAPAAQYVLSQTDLLIEDCKRGYPRAIPFIACLKDELTKTEKIYNKKTRKTRAFFIASFWYLLAYRKYYGTAIAVLTDLFRDIPIKIGIDAGSLDWQQLYEQMSAVSGVGVCMDAKGWDTCIPEEFLKELPGLYNTLYHECSLPDQVTNEDAQVRITLHKPLEAPIVIAHKTVVRFKQGMMSGMPATAHDNSLINWILFYAVYLYLARRHAPNLANWQSFCLFVYLFIYGDDSGATIHERIQAWFNFRTIQATMALFGFTMTGARKDGKDVPDLIPLEEMDFLKRSFRKEQGWVLGPLNIGSIQKSVAWTRQGSAYKIAKAEPYYQMFTDNSLSKEIVEAIFPDIAAHGAKVYYEKLALIKQQMNDRGVLVVYPTWKDALSARGYNVSEDLSYSSLNTF
jgi:hypothetical protein